MKLINALKLLRKNTPALNRLGVKSMAIFGSTVRNEAAPSSDVDVLVTFTEPPTFDQYMETKFLLEDILGCRVDLVIQDGLKPLVRAEVEKEAVYVT
jgi:predicted nucleotidyltransferase